MNLEEYEDWANKGMLKQAESLELIALVRRQETELAADRDMNNRLTAALEQSQASYGALAMELAAAKAKAACADPVVETNVALLRSRSAVGIEKYGTTVAGNKLPLRAWLNHALEETLDNANYLQRAMQEIDAAPAPATPAASVDSFDLQSSEQYRMQMAAICTAALGYWDANDTIDPAYDTPALRDVAKLYAKYMVALGERYLAAPQQHAALSDDDIKAVAINYAAHVAGDVYDVTKYDCAEDFFNCVRAIVASQQPAAVPSPVQREVKS